jgi:hypothetical protein
MNDEMIMDCLQSLGVRLQAPPTPTAVSVPDHIPTKISFSEYIEKPSTTSSRLKPFDVDNSFVFSSDEEDVVDEITVLNNRYNGLMRSQNPNKEKEFTDLMNDYQKFVNSGKLSPSDTQNAQLIISRLNNAITTKNFMLGGRRTYY